MFQHLLGAQPSEVATWTVEQMDAAVETVDALMEQNEGGDDD